MKMFVYSTIEYCATSWFERLRYRNIRDKGQI